MKRMMRTPYMPDYEAIEEEPWDEEARYWEKMIFLKSLENRIPEAQLLKEEQELNERVKKHQAEFGCIDPASVADDFDYGSDSVGDPLHSSSAVSGKKLLRDKKRKSIVRSPEHISMKKKKMKIDQDIGVASHDKKLITLVTRAIDDKMESFEKLLKKIERNQRTLMLHMTSDKNVSDIVKSDDR
ncbi:hypothetical protein vseg_006702 [Gypsophila vaccaria]